MLDTLDILECAEFLKVDRTTALELAGKGELPGAKIGRAWVFLRDDLVEYLRVKVRTQQRQRQIDVDVKQGLDRSAAQAKTKLLSSQLRPGRKRRPLPTLDDLSPPHLGSQVAGA
jgi:excisionase family DNA binding protein